MFGGLGTLKTMFTNADLSLWARPSFIKSSYLAPTFSREFERNTLLEP